jgi:uncharacterized membrane protein
MQLEISARSVSSSLQQHQQQQDKAAVVMVCLLQLVYLLQTVLYIGLHTVNALNVMLLLRVEGNQIRWVNARATQCSDSLCVWCHTVRIPAQ